MQLYHFFTLSIPPPQPIPHKKPTQKTRMSFTLYLHPHHHPQSYLHARRHHHYIKKHIGRCRPVTRSNALRTNLNTPSLLSISQLENLTYIPYCSTDSYASITLSTLAIEALTKSTSEALIIQRPITHNSIANHTHHFHQILAGNLHMITSLAD